MSILESRLLTYNEAAELLRVSKRTVQRLVDNADLVSVKIGQRAFITRDDLDAFIDGKRA